VGQRGGSESPSYEITRVVHLAEAARAPGLQVDLGGQAVENALRPSVGISAAVGVIAAAVVLFIAFGSLLAMLLPLAVAIAGLASGLMTVGLASHAVGIASIGPTMGILIGLGVGIGYALFIVTRHRNNIKAGMTPQDAAASALNSAGRAVLFAGTTVCIALLGMLVLRVGYVSGLCIAARSWCCSRWPHRACPSNPPPHHHPSSPATASGLNHSTRRGSSEPVSRRATTRHGRRPAAPAHVGAPRPRQRSTPPGPRSNARRRGMRPATRPGQAAAPRTNQGLTAPGSPGK